MNGVIVRRDSIRSSESDPVYSIYFCGRTALHGDRPTDLTLYALRCELRPASLVSRTRPVLEPDLAPDRTSCPADLQLDLELLTA